MTSVCLSLQGAFAGARTMFVGLLVFSGLTAAAHCNTGCKPAVVPPVEQYENAIIACAATAGFPGPYDHAADLACRNKVNCRFGLASCHG